MAIKADNYTSFLLKFNQTALIQEDIAIPGDITYTFKNFIVISKLTAKNKIYLTANNGDIVILGKISAPEINLYAKRIYVTKLECINAINFNVTAEEEPIVGRNETEQAIRKILFQNKNVCEIFPLDEDNTSSPL